MIICPAKEPLEVIKSDILRRLPDGIGGRAQVGVVLGAAEQAGGLDKAVDARCARVHPEHAPSDRRPAQWQGLHHGSQQPVQPPVVLAAEPGSIVVALGRRQAGDQRVADGVDALRKPGSRLGRG